jgi:hypothetical protein
MRIVQFCAVLALVCQLTVVTASKADWNPTEPFKWLQNPDPQGFDVNATWKGQTPYFKILADDWLCTSKDPITDIHIWGSWLNNIVDNQNLTFKLSIHRDVPAGVDPNFPYSHPDNSPTGLIRNYIFPPGTYAARIDPNLPQGATERFYDPNTNQIIGGDNQIWQYNFENLPNPFVQEGTTAAPVIYWLDVQAGLPETSAAVFGWKTSRDPHQLDDAVFADTSAFNGPLVGPAPAPVFWRDMFYPAATPSHPTGESMDMAFVITSSIPEPASLILLFVAVGALGMGYRRRRT